MTSFRLSCLLMLAVGLTTTPVFSAAEQPDEIVRQTTYELFETVNQNRERFESDPTELREVVREILLPRIDTVYSGRLVLGRAGRDLEHDQVEEFATALSELLIKQYADALLAFKSRDQVEILPLAGDNTERMTRVRTRVKLSSGSRAPVDYVFRKTDGEWKIFDVIAEGISYVATFRNQIGSQVRQEGFDSVLERLKAGEIEVEFDNEQS